MKIDQNLTDDWYEAQFRPGSRAWVIMKYSPDNPDGEPTEWVFYNENEAEEKADKLNGVEDFDSTLNEF